LEDETMMNEEYIMDNDNETNMDGAEIEYPDTDGETTITMMDDEGNEYEFMIYDEFDYNEETYLLLMTIDEEEPELVIVKVVEGEDSVDSLVSIDEDEYDEIYTEYMRICEEEYDDEDEIEES
jgi:hypothetical protein